MNNGLEEVPSICSVVTVEGWDCLSETKVSSRQGTSRVVSGDQGSINNINHLKGLKHNG